MCLEDLPMFLCFKSLVRVLCWASFHHAKKKSTFFKNSFTVFYYVDSIEPIKPEIVKYLDSGQLLQTIVGFLCNSSVSWFMSFICHLGPEQAYLLDKSL